MDTETGTRRKEARSAPASDFAFHPRWHYATLLFLAVTTALRLAQLPTLELAPDEAYYWDWSRRLALGYYDQGPMIAYVIRLTTALFGTNEFGVRFGALAASLGALVCCYVLARRLFSPLAGFLTVLLLGVTPLMEVGSLIATYDPLLAFFWALTVLLLERALFAPDLPHQRRAWFAAGLAAGGGFLSKHTMLLLVPCLLLFLVLSPAHRNWLRRPEPYLAFLITLLCYSGVFWWNAQNHWWTFGHLLFLAAKSFDNPAKRLGDFLGSQALLLGPGLFVAALAACRQAWRSRQKQELSQNSAFSLMPHASCLSPLFLVCMGLPVFLFFCLMTLKAKAQGNWTPCAWLTLTVLWAGMMAERMRQSPQARRAALRQVVGVAALSGFLTVALISPELRYRLGVHLPPAGDLSNTTYGWRRLAAQVQKVRKEMEQEGRPVFIAGNGYQYCALMAFYLPDHPETHDMFLHFRLTMYAAHVERLKLRLGQNAVFINDGRADDEDLWQVFERVVWEPPFPIWRRPYYAQPIRYLHIARCYGYRRYTGLEWAVGG